MSEAPKQKEIDIPSGVIAANGKRFHVTYSLSTTRYVEYLKQLPKLTFNTTFRGMYDTLSKIYMAASSGNDMIGAIQQARELSINQLNAIKRFDDAEIPDVISFCALFLNEAGEDISKFDQAMHDEKVSTLHQEGYDVSGFFQLQVNLIDGFSSAFLKIQSLPNQEAGTDIRLQSTEQT